MKLISEPTFASGDHYEVKIQLTTGGKWIEFGFMSYVERRELAEQLRAAANELLKVK